MVSSVLIMESEGACTDYIFRFLFQKRLDTVVQYRDACYQQLTIQVQSLEQLNKALCLLEEIEDMENKIHGIYQPIESTYTQLRWAEICSLLIVFFRYSI